MQLLSLYPRDAWGFKAWHPARLEIQVPPVCAPVDDSVACGNTEDATLNEDMP